MASGAWCGPAGCVLGGGGRGAWAWAWVRACAWCVWGGGGGGGDPHARGVLLPSAVRQHRCRLPFQLTGNYKAGSQGQLAQEGKEASHAAGAGRELPAMACTACMWHKRGSVAAQYPRR